MSTWQYDELLRAVRKYLAWCFRHGHQPRVSELAEIVGMPIWLFSRRFKEICGENPSVVLKRAQVQRARRNIARGETVNRAGYAAGFGTRKSVYRAFHRAFGTTPRNASRP
jgi:AraC family transcriptional regulator